ncbi:cGMP-dependent protein kinase egl-4 (Egg-laying defective protein 4) [Durusdinium trenchii]|uniref:cGMP-dependent protein kinase egl-4 (Egg-laying defective protein 4) n=1 Tax=Durusdinium trenchii TaxID=1381693 RepID=A0ABP0MCM6_9DINO
MGCASSAPETSTALAPGKQVGAGAAAAGDRSKRERKVSVAVGSDTDQVQRLVNDFINENEFFGHLSKAQQATVLKTFEVQHFGKKDIVVHKDADPSVFLVVSGTVGLGNGSRNRIVKKGESFGEETLVHKMTHQATGTALEDSVLLRLSLQSHNKLRKHSFLKTFNTHVSETGRAFMISRLEQIQILKDLSSERLLQVSELFKLKLVPKGFPVFVEGDMGDSFYVLAEGELVVTLGGKSGLDLVELKRLKPGDSFGESSLLKKATRTSTVTAIQDTMIFMLQKSEFDDFMSLAPEIYDEIAESIRERSLLNKLSKKFKFGEFLGPNKVHLMSSLAQAVSFTPGEKLFEQGSSKPLKFFVIKSGSVKVYVDGDFVRELKKGDYFGELSILSGLEHSATVLAGDNGTECFTITGDEFQSIFHNEPAVYAELTLKILAHEAELKHVLFHPKGRQAFLAHCEREFAQENVGFFLAADEIERLGEQVVSKEVLRALGYDVEAVVEARFQELTEKVHNVYDRYIDPEAPECVNINSERREKLTDIIRSEEYSYDMFAEAKHAIYHLVERDNFSRFKLSPVFADLLKELGVYERDASRTTVTNKLSKINRTVRRFKQRDTTTKQQTMNRKGGATNFNRIWEQIVD